MIGLSIFSRLVTHLPSEDVKEFGGDGGLAQLVEFKVELVAEFLGVIVGALHGHHTGGLFAGAVLGENILHHSQQVHRENAVEYRFGRRLEDIWPGLYLLRGRGESRRSHGEELRRLQTLAADALERHVDGIHAVNLA